MVVRDGRSETDDDYSSDRQISVHHRQTYATELAGVGLFEIRRGWGFGFVLASSQSAGASVNASVKWGASSARTPAAELQLNVK